MASNVSGQLLTKLTAQNVWTKLGKKIDDHGYDKTTIYDLL